MKKILSFLLVSAVMTAVSCSKGDSSRDAISGAKEVGVITETDASVRIHPLIYSARVAVMAMGDQVEVLDKSKEKAPVAGKLNYWYKVRLRSGITGWIYGANLRIFEGGAVSSIESFAKDLRAEESVKAMKDLNGKWWSVTDNDAFTDNLLSLRDDGTYASMIKGSDKPVEGTYKVDTINAVITFDKGSTVGDSINYIIRGDMYILEAAAVGKRVRFKKISSDPEFKKDMNESEDLSSKESKDPKGEKK